MNVNVVPIEGFATGLRPRPAFVYRHVVSFEETNVVGNVYFTRHISWQGRCREMFLKMNAPEILQELARDLRLVTLRVNCEYFEELNALDEVDIHMSLAHLRQHRIGLNFDIMKLRPPGSNLAARGFQEIGCMRASGAALTPVSPPPSLARALKPFEAATISDLGGQH